MAIITMRLQKILIFFYLALFNQRLRTFIAKEVKEYFVQERLYTKTDTS